MKQDIVLVLPPTKHLLALHEALSYFGMNVSQTEDISSMSAGLALHSPAFLILDVSIEGTKHFLVDVSRGNLSPPPYIIVAGEFSLGPDYAAMLNLGADACVSKPINADEILSVINSVLRRERKITRLHLGRMLPCIEYRDLVIDPLRRTVHMRGLPIVLTVKEFDVLYYLAYHSGKVLRNKEIYEAVWKSQYFETTTSVSEHISAIRKKLGLSSRDKNYIQTVFGMGYRFAQIEQNI